MIVHPDFLDHWKTQLLVRLLNTPAAPIYVMRLWAHCQTRKSMDGKFEGWTPEILASVCRWEGSADVFWSAMAQTFVDASEGFIVVHQWADENASLISAWKNGGKGGRPVKNNPPKTHGFPMGNPPVTHGATDKIREDKRREDETRLEDDSNTGKRASAPASPWHVAFGIELPASLQTENCLSAVKLWMKHKSEKRDAYKQTGLKMALSKWANEFSADEFPSIVEHSIASGWKRLFRPNTQPQPPTRYGTSTPSDAHF